VAARWSIKRAATTSSAALFDDRACRLPHTVRMRIAAASIGDQ
jgi:hypothetical protein